jgi:hypothetical protein
MFKKSIIATTNEDDDKKSEKSELEEELNPEDDSQQQWSYFHPILIRSNLIGIKFSPVSIKNCHGSFVLEK